MLSKLILNIQKKENKKLNILLTNILLIYLCKKIINNNNINIDIITNNIFQSRLVLSKYKCNIANYNKNNIYDIIILNNILSFLYFFKHKNYKYIFSLNKLLINQPFLQLINTNIGFLYKNILYVENKILHKTNVNTTKNISLITNNKKDNINDRFNIFLLETQILIRSKDRLLYLVYTLNSLLSTNLYSSKITIVDDKSTSKKLNDFLFTNKNILLLQIDFYLHIKDKKSWNNYIGILPNLPKCVKGIKNKIQVKQFLKCFGDCKGLLETIKYGFLSNKNCKLIIVLEDDILLSKNWLTILYNTYEQFKNEKIAAIPLFHNKENIKANYFYDVEFVGPGVCYTRDFYNKLKENNIFLKLFLQCNLTNLERKNIPFILLLKYNIAGDTHLAYYANKFEFKNIHYKNSIIQHIGIQSTLNKDLPERYSKNFIGLFTYNKNSIDNLTIYKNNRILIFSNINFLKLKILQLNIDLNDLLVFLNTSIPIKYFLNHKNKIIFYRYGTLQYFGLNLTIDIDCKKYAIDGPNNCITEELYKNILKEYSQLFLNKKEVIYKNTLKDYHKFRQGPTTGWIVQYLMKLRYPKAKILLINFFPTLDNSTAHFVGHDWKFLNLYYKNNLQLKIHDLRTPFECVYIVDNNEKYLEYCKLSIDTLLKFNPNAKINIVSLLPVNLPYNNIIISDLNNIKLKHNLNDRITSSTYLKLLLTKLPFDKCLVIDPDTIIKANLYNLFISNILYMGCTQSHNYGIKQAKLLNHLKYFLAGLMIMNLKKLRLINFYDKVMSCYTNFSKYKDVKTWQHLLTILNIEFYNLITLIHRRYNYCYNRTYTDNLTYNEVCIYHFPGLLKNNIYNIYNKVMNNG